MPLGRKDSKGECVMRLEDLGLRTFVADEYWREGLETEEGHEVLEAKYTYIQHEPRILRRRGFLIVVKDLDSNYSLVLLRPKDGLKNGYWDFDPMGEWRPNHKTAWVVETWTDEVIKKLKISSKILPISGGWFVSQSFHGKFDYRGMVATSEDQLAAFPPPEPEEE